MKQLYTLLSLFTFCTLLFGCTEDDPEIKITSFTFNTATVEVVEGTTIDLNDYLTIEGEDAGKAELVFTTDNEKVVTVDGTTLSAVAVGNAVIEATETNTNKTATINVKVLANLVAVTGVTLDKSEANLKVGETLQLTATIAPTDATEKGVIWSVAFPPASKTSETSPTDIATVSDAGLVTAKVAGDVVITATTKDGDFTANVDISITNVAVTGVTIDNAPISIAGSTTYQLTASVAPENATNKTVIWSLYLAEEARIKDEISIPILVPITSEYYAEINEETGVITSKNPCDNCGLMAVATTFEGEFSHELPVEITYVAVSSISLDPTSFTIDIDGTQQMTPTISPPNASNKNVTWSIDLDFSGPGPDVNPNDFASVSETGLVTGIAPETFDIVVKATSVTETEVFGSASITVNPILATSIEIRDSDGFAFDGKTVNLPTCTESFQLYINVLPNDASDMSVTWSISDETEWSVDPSSGLLTIPLSDADGTFRVNVTANDGSGVTDYVDVIDNGCS